MSTIPPQQQCQLSNCTGNVQRSTIRDSQTIRLSGVEEGCSEHSECSQDEELVIEDLEPNLESTCIDNSSLESLATAHSTDSLHSQPAGDVFASDFIAYQGADLTAFFGEQLEPQRVSEVCLVSDNFILVKMPGSYGRHNSQMECIVEEMSGSGSRDPLTAATREYITKRENGRFGRYFRCTCNRHISPEQNQQKNSSERAEPSAKMKLKCPVTYCWRANRDEHETFETCDISNTRQSAGRVINVEPILVEPAEALDLSSQRLRIQQRSVTTPLTNSNNSASAPKTQQMEMRGTHVQPDNRQLQTSLHDTVQLEQHVTLATPVKFRQNGIHLNDEKSVASRQKSKPTRRFDAFHWLLKSLRSRSRKPKAKPKVHAVVYKTYFVRWKKSPDELCHCCGKAKSRRSTSVDDVSRLRRSRSATF